MLSEFSQRTTDVRRRLDEKLGRFRTDLGRDPTEKERWRLEREAVVDSRPSKPHPPSLTELRQEWRERVRSLGRDPQRVVQIMIGHQCGLEGIDDGTAAWLVEEALRSLGDRQSSWRPAELVRELAAATPTTVTVDSGQLAQRGRWASPGRRAPLMPVRSSTTSPRSLPARHRTPWLMHRFSGIGPRDGDRLTGPQNRRSIPYERERRNRMLETTRTRRSAASTCHAHTNVIRAHHPPTTHPATNKLPNVYM